MAMMKKYIFDDFPAFYIIFNHAYCAEHPSIAQSRMFRELLELVSSLASKSELLTPLTCSICGNLVTTNTNLSPAIYSL